jgi:hypothetical protein
MAIMQPKQIEKQFQRNLRELGACPKCWATSFNQLVFGGSKDVYTYEPEPNRVYAWAVFRLLQFINNNTGPVQAFLTTVPRAVIGARVAELLATEAIDPEHAKHVNPIIPGIIGVDPLDPENSLVIDGNHRAYRCWQEGRDFVAYGLPVEITSLFAYSTEPLTHEQLQELVDVEIRQQIADGLEAPDSIMSRYEHHPLIRVMTQALARMA